MRPCNYYDQHGHWMWECLDIYKLKIDKHANFFFKNPKVQTWYEEVMMKNLKKRKFKN